jgi:hypothetical protein
VKKSGSVVVLALISLLVLAGCAGVQYTDLVTPVTLTAGNAEATTRVIAKSAEWRNSGVNVEVGKKYFIKASGRWRIGGLCGLTGPDGAGCYTPLCWDLGIVMLRGYTGSALIGKIGEVGDLFAVGNELALDPKESGTLYFRINEPDAFIFDNEGYMDVTVSLTGAPETAAPPSPAAPPPAAPAPPIL